MINNTRLLISINENNILLKETEVDFHQDSDLAPRIIKRLFNLSTFENAIGDYTLNLNLPKTNKNLQIFNYLGDAQTEDNFFSLRKYNAKIQVNYIDILVGVLTVDSITNDDYSCTIIGHNINFVTLFGDRNLRQLKNMPIIRYSGLLGTNGLINGTNIWPQNIANSITLSEIWRTDESSGLGIQFPLVAYANFGSDYITQPPTLNPFSAAFTTSNSIGIKLTAFIERTEKFPWDQFEFHPAGYLKTVFKKIFEEQNYKVAGDFIDDPETDNILLPYTDSSSDDPLWNWGLLGQCDAKNNGYSFASFPGALNDWYNTYVDSYQIGDYNSVSKTTIYYDVNDIWTEKSINPDTPHIISEDIIKDYSFHYRLNQGSYLAPIQANYKLIFFAAFGSFIKRYVYLGNQFQAPQVIIPADIPILRLIIWISNNYFDSTKLSITDRNLLIQGIIPTTEAVFISNNLCNNANPISTPAFPNAGTISEWAYDIIWNILPINETINISMESGQILSYFWITNDGTIPNQTTGADPLTIDTLISINTQEFIINSIIVPTTNIDKNSIENITSTALSAIDLNTAVTLPDISIKNFVSSIIKMFNLFYVMDEVNKIIIFNYHGSYFFPNSTALDWSNKCSIKEATITASNNYKLINFKFTEQSNEFITNAFKDNYIYNSQSNYYYDNFNIDIIWAMTYNRTYMYLFRNNSNIDNFNISIPTLNSSEDYIKPLGQLSSGEQSIRFNYTPRLLKWDGYVENGKNGQFFIGRTGGPDGINLNINTGPIYNLNDLSINFGLNFRYPKASIIPWLHWQDKSSIDLGLFSRFYANQVKSNEKSIIFTLPVMLTPDDINSLDFRRPIIINHQLYIIQSIDDYNPVINTPTKVTFYKKLF